MADHSPAATAPPTNVHRGDFLIAFRTSFSSATCFARLRSCARVAKHCSLPLLMFALSQSCANPNLDDHKKRNDDELQMARGDMIHLEDMDEEFQDGWWFGKHVSTGEKGLFPACMCFCEELTSDINRSWCNLIANTFNRFHSQGRFPRINSKPYAPKQHQNWPCA